MNYNNIPRKEVVSSTIKSIGWDSNVLVIEFKTGAIYAYMNVNATEYNNLMSSESIGKYFHANIKGKYTSEKL